MKIKTLAAVAVLSFAPLMAHAEAFLELGIGQATVDLSELGGTSSDEKDTTFAISGGYMFNPMIGAEIGYRDLGEASASATGPGGTATASLKADGFFFGGVGRIPVAERLSIVPRLGFFMWDASGEVRLNGALVGTADDDGTDLYFGIGADYRFTDKAHAGVHFVRYDLDGDDVDVLEFKVGFRF